MQQVNMYEAKTHFSELISQALMGEDIVIAKAGKPLVKLVPYSSETPERHPGSAKGKIDIADDFNAPLPDDILNDFYQDDQL
jgi:prevent-host-death family protein